MEQSFWHQKWNKGELGFHQSEINPFLVAHFSQFNLKVGCRIFVPLCGKSLDMVWLRNQGFDVVGIELVPSAVEQFFAELDVAPEITPCGELTSYRAAGVELFVGDFFALSAPQLGVVDLIYDRAALVALPPAMRVEYAQRLKELCAAAPQLLVTFDYDQSRLDGPPFSVPGNELQQLYGDRYALSELGSAVIEGGPRGDIGAREIAWQLLPIS